MHSSVIAAVAHGDFRKHTLRTVAPVSHTLEPLRDNGVYPNGAKNGGEGGIRTRVGR